MEYITANGTKYECQKVTTSTNSISFTMEGQEIDKISTAFKDVTELTVSSESGEVYGTYSNLVFESATVFDDGTVAVTMHIPNETELRLSTIEDSQAEQDDMIAELMFGGEE